MNFKRKKPRTKGLGCGNCCPGSKHGEAPSHWNILYNNRPKRRADRRNCNKVMHGQDSDGLTWELGNRKPHQYYW